MVQREDDGVHGRQVVAERSWIETEEWFPPRQVTEPMKLDGMPPHFYDMLAQAPWHHEGHAPLQKLGPTVREGRVLDLPVPWGRQQQLRHAQAEAERKERMHLQEEVLRTQQAAAVAAQKARAGCDPRHPMPEFAMYPGGPRTVIYSEHVPVPEANNGVMINAEYATPASEAKDPMEILFHDDEAIRNKNWRNMGPFLERRDAQQALSAYLQAHADSSLAYDFGNHVAEEPQPWAPARFLPARKPNFHAMNSERSSDNYVRASENVLAREIMSAPSIEGFFQSPEQMMYSTLE